MAGASDCHSCAATAAAGLAAMGVVSNETFAIADRSKAITFARDGSGPSLKSRPALG